MRTVSMVAYPGLRVWVKIARDLPEWWFGCRSRPRWDGWHAMHDKGTSARPDGGMTLLEHVCMICGGGERYRDTDRLKRTSFVTNESASSLHDDTM